MQQVVYIIISEHAHNQRIDNFLLTHLKGVPRSHVYQLLQTGQVRVNGGRIKPRYRIQTGDKLRIPPVHHPASGATKTPSRTIQDALLEAILYQDSALVVINKPASMASHGGSGQSIGVVEALRVALACPHLSLVHRLDKGTSGCLVLTKKRATLVFLQKGLRDRQWSKCYWALVHGDLAAATWVKEPLLATRRNEEKWVAIDPNGQSASTFFYPLLRFGQYTLVAAEPVTGRTHQIRVHATHLGHPLVGDRKYGHPAQDALGVGRLWLHARKLELPYEDGMLSVSAPLNPELERSLRALGKQTDKNLDTLNL